MGGCPARHLKENSVARIFGFKKNQEFCFTEVFVLCMFSFFHFFICSNMFIYFLICSIYVHIFSIFSLYFQLCFIYLSIYSRYIPYISLYIPSLLSTLCGLLCMHKIKKQRLRSPGHATTTMGGLERGA